MLAQRIASSMSRMDDEKYESLSAAIAELAEAVGVGLAKLDRKVDRGFAKVDAQFAEVRGELGLLKSEQRTTNRRLEAIETRLGALEVKRRR